MSECPDDYNTYTQVDNSCRAIFIHGKNGIFWFLCREKGAFLDDSVVRPYLMRNGKKEASWSLSRNPVPATSFQLLWTRNEASVFLTMLWQNLGLKKLKRYQ